MVSSITTVSNVKSDFTIAHAATTLGANLKDMNQLSPNEKDLLQEWLDRISVSS
jgi:hypothetical protein